MKSCFVAAVVAAFLCTGVTAKAGFVPDAGNFVKFTDGAGSTGGGEFKGDVDSGSGYDTYEDFRTFCAEISPVQYLSMNTEYEVLALSTTTTTGKTLTNGAAWLFDQFSQLGVLGYSGSIGSEAYNSGSRSHTASANLLQKALWTYLQQDVYSQTTSNNAYMAVADAALTGMGMSATAAYTGTSVRILNLVKKSNGAAAQDQLVWDSSGAFLSAPVPEPMSAALWLMGLTGAAYARRRKLNRA